MSKSSASQSFIAVVGIVAVAVTAIVALRHTGFRDSAHVAAQVVRPETAPAVGAAQRSQSRANQVRANLGALPLAFEANRGQTDPRVKFVARGSGYTLFLTENDAVFGLHSSTRPMMQTRAGNGLALASPTPAVEKDLTAGIYMHVVQGNSRPQMVAGGELSGKSNYFIGSDRSRWQPGVKQYAAVSYREVYPGVDLAFHGQQRQVEFDFVVAPGANAAPIAMRFSGARKISADATGGLTLASSAGNVTLHAPVSYQERNGVRQIVDSRFVLKARNEVGFALGDYDRSRQLVIDPAISYATYLGGNAEDDGYSIAVDASGNVYVTGQTKSPNFPTVAGAYSASNKGDFDVFVTKISPDGSTLLYSTYVGGSAGDSGNGIAVDALGNAFVAGGTNSNDFPTTSGALQTNYGGALDAFVFELNASGGTLTYSTYLGGTDADVANGIAVDGTGNTYIVGSTASMDFPAHNPLQGLAGSSNGFVTKLNSSGSALVYSTYLGGGSDDFAAGVAVDAAGDAYVTGGTQNSGFPTTAGAFQTTCGTAANCNGSLTDAFVTVYKADGSGFIYSTFLGGSAGDQGLGIAVDSSGDAYVTGLTQSSDFPTKAPAIQGVFGGGTQDAFVTELNSAGSALVYSTYLGGTADDSATSIAVDGGGNAYVTGRTASGNFPTASPTQIALDGVSDAFVSEISSTGSQLVFSTFLGGKQGEDTSTVGVGALGAIAVDANGANIYVTGNTNSPDFPVSATPPQDTYGLAVDAFVVKYGQANFSIAATAPSPASVNPGSSATSTVSLTALNSFSSSVALTCAVSPSGANAPTCSYNNASITPGTSSTLTIATTASTVGGAYTVTVTGTSAGFVHATTVGVSVAAPDFTIAATALTAVAQGGSTTSTITITALDGYAGTVNFTCSVTSVTGGAPLPTCSIPNAVTGGSGTSTLTVKTTGSSSRAMNSSRGSSNILYAMWLPIFGLSLAGMRFSTTGSRHKKLLGFLLLGGMIAALFFLPACGGSNNSGGGGGGGCSGCTPTGSYTVTVTGTDPMNSALTHSVSPALTLTVN